MRDIEKRRASWRAYYYRNRFQINYGRSRRRLRQRIVFKRELIAELEEQFRQLRIITLALELAEGLEQRLREQIAELTDL